MVSELNTGLAGFENVAKTSLTTPEQALSYFLRKSRDNDFLAAARVLNLSQVGPENQETKGAVLARKLYIVLKRQTGFPFDRLPDRTDGYMESPSSSSNNGATEKRYRQSFLLGALPLDIGEFEIYLNRYATDEIDSAWMFAPATVDEIEEAYDEMGPREWEESLPGWLRETQLFHTPVWAWLLLWLAILGSIGLTLAVFKSLRYFVNLSLLKKLEKGLLVFIATTVPYATLVSWAPLPSLIFSMLVLLAVCSLIFLISSTLNYFSNRLIRGDLDSVEDLDGAGRHGDKKTLTYLSVGRRLLSFLVLLIGVGFIALNTPRFESVGVGMLASAGVLSVLLGAAAQPVMGNFISGLQIGVTRPVRVGDSIIYEGTWCYVEDITFMYVMCRTWDEMRLVIPLRYFTSNPFKSDSLSDPRAMRVVEIPLDYTVDVAALRKRYLEIVEESELWDEGHEPELEVISFDEDTITIRVVAWSMNASSAWKLHCRIREELLHYLQKEQPNSLPRRRLSLQDDIRDRVEQKTNGHTPKTNGVNL